MWAVFPHGNGGSWSPQFWEPGASKLHRGRRGVCLVASNRATRPERSAGSEPRAEKLRGSLYSAKGKEGGHRDIQQKRDRFDFEQDSNGAEIAGDEIDIVVAHIKRLAQTASLEFTLRVGAVIIHHFHAGDAESWRIVRLRPSV
jgi:hypothetical protein